MKHMSSNAFCVLSPASDAPQREAGASDSTPATCPICSAECRPANESYTLSSIFDAWARRGYRFSENVIHAYDTNDVVQLYECASCGYAYFSPAILGTSLFYDELSRIGASWYYLEDKWEYQEALQDVSACTRILDLGCGGGFFLERCRARGIPADGIELNPQAAREARRKGFTIHETHLASFAAAHAGCYDAFTMFQVLEHVADPLTTVREALMCLRAGGLLVIGVPNASGIVGKMSQLPANVPPHHVTRWTGDSLVAMAAQLDLDVVAVRYEPVYRMMAGYIQERFCSWVPDAVKRSWPWRAALDAPWKVLGAMRPQGFKSMPGHTVYCVLRKKK
jgi:SAM-dependent methyltransferase